jgi:hypothetical protein
LFGFILLWHQSSQYFRWVVQLSVGLRRRRVVACLTHPESSFDQSLGRGFSYLDFGHGTRTC